jgi:hypothetical protein
VTHDQAILNIKAFDLAPGVIINDAAIGHYAIHVEENCFYAGGLFDLIF